ncbi:UNVERIFIED_CONTAM: hypothetical protein GTU68_025989, partial [Idotea baltica]|nr:hypothetical protein [Idotea baltica]
MNKIKKGDEVIVNAGKDKGRRGTVKQVLVDGRVLVDGINMVKKTQKPNPNTGITGGIIDKEMAIDRSNLMMFNPATGKGDRVGIKQLEDSTKVRYFKSNDTVRAQLMEEFSYGNVMQIPHIEKITLNMGLGEATKDKKVVEHAVSDMVKIAGQKAVVTLSRKSIAGFNIRDEWPIGCKVTLRNVRMYEFLDRLINIAIPRIRDFRGISGKAFDGRGNYNMGVKEQ